MISRWRKARNKGEILPSTYSPADHTNDDDDDDNKKKGRQKKQSVGSFLSISSPFKSQPSSESNHVSNSTAGGNSSSIMYTTPIPKRKQRRSRHSPAGDHSTTGSSTPMMMMSSPGMAMSGTPTSPSSSSAAPYNSCNTFLLGGAYYPGKDKQRRHLRQRTLWHRSLCSSLPRQIITTCILLYLIVWCGCLPLYTRLKIWGERLSHHSSSSQLQQQQQQPGEDSLVRQKRQTYLNRVHETAGRNREYNHDTVPEDDTLLQSSLQQTKRLKKEWLRPMVIKQREQESLQTILETHNWIQEEKRMGVLEKIISSWYHRNDTPDSEIVQGEEVVGEEVGNGNNEEEKINDQHNDVRQINDKVVENKEEDAATQNHDTRDVESISNEKDEQKTIQVQDKKQKSTTQTSSQNENHAASNKTNQQEKDSSNTNHILRSLENESQHGQYSQCSQSTTTTINNNNNNNLSTTLVTQTTVDRLPLLLELCHRWGGTTTTTTTTTTKTNNTQKVQNKNNIIAVVYLSPKDVQDTNGEGIMDEILSSYEEACSSNSNNNQLTLLTHVGISESEQRMAYPINVLRNIGLDQVTTSHVMVVDVDFVPSENLSGDIELALSSRQRQFENQQQHQQQKQHPTSAIDLSKDALVIPAFERKLKEPCETIEECRTFLEKDASFIPRTKDELKHCYKEGNCIVFQSDINPDGHSSSQSEEWLLKKQEEENRLKMIPCFQSYRYEPYVVIPWCQISENNEKQQELQHHPISPYYDERFFGYGKNKIQHISHLRARGYSFSVIPNGFITHYPHPESSTKETWNKKSEFDLHRNMDRLYPKYLKELHSKYQNVDVTTPICGRRKIVER